MIAAVMLFRALLERFGTYTAVMASAGAYLAVVILAAPLMPTVNEIGDFPADTLWYFRRGSLMTLATLWGVIGIALTGLIGKLYAQESHRRPARIWRPACEHLHASHPAIRRRSGSSSERLARSRNTSRRARPAAATSPFGLPRPRAPYRQRPSTACAR